MFLLMQIYVIMEYMKGYIQPKHSLITMDLVAIQRLSWYFALAACVWMLIPMRRIINCCFFKKDDVLKRHN